MVRSSNEEISLQTYKTQCEQGTVEAAKYHHSRKVTTKTCGGVVGSGDVSLN